MTGVMRRALSWSSYVATSLLTISRHETSLTPCSTDNVYHFPCLLAPLDTCKSTASYGNTADADTSSRTSSQPGVGK